MRLSERCALWRLLPVWVVSLHATKEDTHITHSTHVLSLSLPLSLSLSLWHTHTHSHTHICIWSRIKALKRKTGWMLSAPACRVCSEQRGQTGCGRLFPQDRSGTVSTVVWLRVTWSKLWSSLTGEQLGWWERRLVLALAHDFVTYFFLLKQLALAFSDYITFFQRWMWSWRVFWEPTLFFRWMCQERLALIFKRFTDKRLKRSVALGICAMKYASEFAKRVWPCDLLKYCLLQNIWFFLNRHLDDSCFLICKTKKEKKHKRDRVMI